MYVGIDFESSVVTNRINFVELDGPINFGASSSNLSLQFIYLSIAPMAPNLVGNQIMQQSMNYFLRQGLTRYNIQLWNIILKKVWDKTENNISTIIT